MDEPPLNEDEAYVDSLYKSGLCGYRHVNAFPIGFRDAAYVNATAA